MRARLNPVEKKIVETAVFRGNKRRSLPGSVSREVRHAYKSAVLKESFFTLLESPKYARVFARAKHEGWLLIDFLRRLRGNNVTARQSALNLLGCLVSPNPRITHREIFNSLQFVATPEEKSLIKKLARVGSLYALKNDDYIHNRHTAIDNLALIADPSDRKLFLAILNGNPRWLYTGLTSKLVGGPETKRRSERFEENRASWSHVFKYTAMDGLARIGKEEDVEMLLRISAQKTNLGKFAMQYLAENATPKILRRLFSAADLSNLADHNISDLQMACQSLVKTEARSGDNRKLNVFSMLQGFSYTHALGTGHAAEFWRDTQKGELAIPEPQLTVMMVACALGKFPNSFTGQQLIDLGKSKTPLELARQYGLVK